jgi:uridine kinase
MLKMKSQPALPRKINQLLARSQDHQIVMGLTGGSGSGKSTIAAIIQRKLTPFLVNIVPLDQFFFPVAQMPRYFSPSLGKDQPNFNQPEAIDFQRMLAFCRTLAGFDLQILEGHFALYSSKMRALMDVKCFVTIDLDEMLERRTLRNLKNHYGGHEAHIRHYNMECVVPMYREHILPCQDYADILIPNSSTDRVARDQVIEVLCASIAAKLNRHPTPREP